MPAMSESELKVKIKSSPVGAYLFYGEESYLVGVYTDMLIKATVDESFADFNLHIFDSDDPDLSGIYESVSSVPVMAQSKCVVVKNYPVEAAGEGDFKALEQMLEDNPPDNCLIFAYPSFQPKTSDATKLSKLFSKYGVSVKFDKKSEQDLIKIVEKGAAKRGKKFERGASALFVNNVGENLNLLVNELEKVCAYAQGDITKADIEAVCIKSLDANVFYMVNDLVRGNFDKAFHTLSDLFESREDEYKILGAVISQYSDMYRAKAAFSAGAPVSAVAQAYPGYAGKEFRLTKALGSAKSMSLEKLGECISILSQADIRLKSTQDDKRSVLEQTLVKLARAAAK